MDINALMSSMLSGDSIKGLSKATGTTQTNVKNVLASALPSLLSGAKEQATNSSTAQSFSDALADHAKDNTGDITSFLSSVNVADGSKIIGHLLGSNQASTTKEAAKSAGISTGKAGSILSAAAPLLMSLLGQQAGKEGNSASGIAGIMGSLLGNADMGSLISGLVGGAQSSDKKDGGSILKNIFGMFKG